jgi:hypothetical protein
VIQARPPASTVEEEAIMRYRVTEGIDDIRLPRSRDELTASGTDLHRLIAEYYCRSTRHWSAKGKSIPRVLRKLDPAFADRFAHGFERLFEHGEQSSAIALAEDVLRTNCGWLFEGHRSDAPAEWRTRNWSG